MFCKSVIVSNTARLLIAVQNNIRRGVASSDLNSRLMSVKQPHPTIEQRTQAFQEELKHSSDTFGNYSDITSKFDVIKDDSEDISERKRLKQMDRRNPAFYIDVIKGHLDKHELEKALIFLEERMLKIDKVKPDSYIYDLLISYCGRIGNVKLAFRLYNQVKQRGYHVTGGQYTSVFNAAATSKSSNTALTVAAKVRRGLAKDEFHRANIKNYNAMLKAFGRHGDMKTCLEIMDEVLERRGKVLADTYNFLLQACVSDTNSGFTHALLMWHKMLQNKTDPTLFSFNLMLRVVRDCSLGPPDRLQQLIQTILNEKSTRFFRKLRIHSEITTPLLKDDVPNESIVLIEPTTSNMTENSIRDKDPLLRKEEYSSNLLPDVHKSEGLSAVSFEGPATLRDETRFDGPNLLALVPKLGSVVDLASFTTSYHRLMLLGGATGFLEVMDSICVQPDMKTFTLLLEVIPSTTQAELDLMEIIKNKNIKFDSGFFNYLIKKRSFRFDDEGAKEVLHLMQLEGITPDLLTFGCLALGCRERKTGEALLHNIKAAGFRANSQILGSLVRHATYQQDLEYLRMVLNVMKEEDVQPGPKLMVLIDQFMIRQQTKLNSQ